MFSRHLFPACPSLGCELIEVRDDGIFILDVANRGHQIDLLTDFLGFALLVNVKQIA